MVGAIPACLLLPPLQQTSWMEASTTATLGTALRLLPAHTDHLTWQWKQALHLGRQETLPANLFPPGRHWFCLLVASAIAAGQTEGGSAHSRSSSAVPRHLPRHAWPSPWQVWSCSSAAPPPSQQAGCRVALPTALAVHHQISFLHRWLTLPSSRGMYCSWKNRKRPFQLFWPYFGPVTEILQEPILGAPSSQQAECHSPEAPFIAAGQVWVSLPTATPAAQVLVFSLLR